MTRLFSGPSIITASPPPASGDKKTQAQIDAELLKKRKKVASAVTRNTQRKSLSGLIEEENPARLSGLVRTPTTGAASPRASASSTPSPINIFAGRGFIR